MYQTIVEAVLAHGQSQPDKLAVAFKKEQLNYGQLCDCVRRMARLLSSDYGVQKGDAVMAAAVSKPEYVAAYLAIQYLGAISVPVDKAAKLANVEDVYDYIQPRLLLSDFKIGREDIRNVSLKQIYARCVETDGGRTESLPNEKTNTLPAGGEKWDIAEMLFTTGTTGKPKGVMLSIGNIYASTHNTWRGVGMRPEDVVLIPLPLNHSVGMRVMRTALYIGASLVLQNGFTFAREIEKNIDTFGCTAMVSVPASIEMVYRQMQEKFPEIVGRLRYLEIGAGSLSYDAKKRFVKILPHTTIINTWGSSETGGAIFLNVSEHPDKYASIGKPVEGVEVRAVNAQGETIIARDMETAGRMALRGKMQMQGYYRMPELTGETFVDGWLLSNDIVYMDEDGYVYMLGRADDIINVGGEKVSPVEVENLAQEYDGIRECACIGVEDPDGLLGQVPVLFLVPENDGLKDEELTVFLAEKMEKYKLPKRYIRITELPRNRMKKLNRKALRKLWEEQGELELMNPVIENLLSRRSIREFTDQEIPEAYLEMLVKCGYYAPSGHNMQTWRFTVVRDAERIRELRDAVEQAAKAQKVLFYGFQNPKVLILVSNDRRNGNAVQDSACAAENIMLAAHSYGIGSVWLNALSKVCDVPEVRSLLQAMEVPDTHIVWSMIALGYPAKPGKLLAKKENVVKWF